MCSTYYLTKTYQYVVCKYYLFPELLLDGTRRNKPRSESSCMLSPEQNVSSNPAQPTNQLSDTGAYCMPVVPLLVRTLKLSAVKPPCSSPGFLHTCLSRTE